MCTICLMKQKLINLLTNAIPSRDVKPSSCCHSIGRLVVLSLLVRRKWKIRRRRLTTLWQGNANVVAALQSCNFTKCLTASFQRCVNFANIMVFLGKLIFVVFLSISCMETMKTDLNMSLAMPDLSCVTYISECHYCAQFSCLMWYYLISQISYSF